MEYVISILIFLCLLFYLFWNKNLKPVKFNPEEICELLESWINNDIDWKEWDYFQSCIIKNKKLESIRQRCIDIDHFESEYLDHSGENMSVLNEKGRIVVEKLLIECRAIDKNT